ncbi:MAG: hypothetical protein P8Q33_07235 [Polaribacter sp.]|nr:hypothetical protein [Polaribacter sp.]
MHKRLETDLISLAHSILQMKNKGDVFALKEKSRVIYEKLSLLAFVEEYVNTTPDKELSKNELLSKVEKALELKELKVKDEAPVSEIVTEVSQEEADLVLEEVEVNEELSSEINIDAIIAQPFDELEALLSSEEETLKEPVSDTSDSDKTKIVSLEEELQDTIPVDEIATLFDLPVPKSLNDTLAINIQIGLNDRIAFVKNLFDGSQEDFNRVLSQLNTYTSEKEAMKFIKKMVKPDYDWSEQAELEARFLEIIERKFI